MLALVANLTTVSYLKILGHKSLDMSKSTSLSWANGILGPGSMFKNYLRL